MKKTIILMLSVLISITSFAQNQTQGDNSSRTRVLKEIANRSTVIFEGKLLSKNKSFFGKGENIYTSFTIEVSEVLLGNITKGTIEIIVPGGQLEKDGIGYDQDLRGLSCSGYSTYFCQPSSLSSGVAHTNRIPLSIVDNECYDSKGNISAPSSSGGDIDPSYEPFKNIKDLYTELNKIKPITIPKEKKSPNVEDRKKTGQIPTDNPTISYSQRIENYTNYLQLISAKAESNKFTTSTRAVNDLTLSFANAQVTGTSPRYFEFDVFFQARNFSAFF